MKSKTTVLALLMCIVMSPSASAQELDIYGGFTDIKGTKTGFFHTQKVDGRWWLVTPEGNGFFGIGLSHPVTGFSRDAVTYSYKGDQEAWLRDGIKKMRSWVTTASGAGPTAPNAHGLATSTTSWPSASIARRRFLTPFTCR